MSEEPKSISQKFWQRLRRFIAVIFLLAAVACIAATLAALATDGWRHINEDLWFIAWVGVIGAACGVIVLYPVPKFFGRLILRFIRGLFTRRFWKWALIILACITALIALFYTEEDLRGKWAWENYKRTWEAKGEKLDLVSLAPPPVPDDQNFAMTLLLKPIFDYDVLTNASEMEDRVRHRDTNAWARLQNINATLAGSRIITNRLWANLDRGTFIDLEGARMFYRDNENYPQPKVSKSAAEDVLVALGKFDAEFQELEEAATTRHLARFPIAYDYDPPSDILLPHLSVVKSISICAEVRAIAKLELGQSKEALTELNLCFRLSDSIQHEPFLISHLVRIADLTMALQVIREGLFRHAWSDAQLGELESYLATVDLLAEYNDVMRGERTRNVTEMNYLRRHKWQLKPNLFYPDNFWLAVRYALVPSGWYYQNMLAISRLYQDEVLWAVDAKTHRLRFEAPDPGQTTGGNPYLGPYHFLVGVFFPATKTSMMKSVRSQTYVDAARCACALERYRLVNGELPKTLDALVPRFIDKIPNDVIDGYPLRYHPVADGNYIVYSIGWNQIDDDGVRGWRSDYSGARVSLDFTQGDWVWSSAAP